jgi:hypothetical protein
LQHATVRAHMIHRLCNANLWASHLQVDHF